MEPNLDTTGSVILARYLTQEPNPNLKNLNNDERKKIKKLMKNLIPIVENSSISKRSPVTFEEAEVILSKLRNSERLEPQKPLLSAAKKLTSVFRVTIEDLETAHAAMMKRFQTQELLNPLSEQMGKRFAEAISLISFVARNEKNDWAQRKCLDRFRDVRPHISTADIKANKKEWLSALDMLVKLKTVGQESASRKKEMAGFILAMLAASGCLDEEFANDWKSGTIGDTTEMNGTFKLCMAASHAINKNVDKAKLYLTNEDKQFEQGKQIQAVIDANASDESIRVLQNQVGKIWSSLSAFG